MLVGKFRLKGAAFRASIGSALTNKTGDGAVYDIVYDSEDYDDDGAHASGVYSALLTGRHRLGGVIDATGFLVGHNLLEVQLVTSAATYAIALRNPQGELASGEWRWNWYFECPMTKDDTAKVRVAVYNSTKVIGFAGSGKNCFFGGIIGIT